MEYLLAVAALGLGITANAQSLARTCPETDICFSLNIPESTASSGDGDIYFQITAPTTYQWVGLGQGSRMAGANIFVVYTSADGQNVTVSPRLGTGHVEPQHNADAQVTLLEGSGVENGVMTANVRCSSCNTWSGGNMDFTTQSASWIHAYKNGQAMNTDDVAAGLSFHDGYAPFDWDMATAKGGSSVNPFAATTDSTSTGNNNTTSNTSNTSSSSNSAPFGGDFAMGDRVQRAHGVLAALAFVAFFPTGGILIRIASFTGVIWIHAAIQAFAYAIFITAFGLGIYLAKETDHLSDHHPIIGIVLFVVLFFQPVTGWVHHLVFRKRAGRSIWSWEHIGIGRIAIILGMINGGLGIQLAGGIETGYIAAYGVCAGVMGLLYIAAILYGEMKRKRNPPPTYDTSQRAQSRELESHDGSPNGRGYYSKESGH